MTEEIDQNLSITNVNFSKLSLFLLSVIKKKKKSQLYQVSLSPSFSDSFSFTVNKSSMLLPGGFV